MYIKYRGNRRKVNTDAKTKHLYITLNGKKLYLNKIAKEITMIQKGGCTIQKVCTTNANNTKTCTRNIVNITFSNESQFAEYKNTLDSLQARATREDKLLYQITEQDTTEFMKYMMEIRINVPGTELYILPSHDKQTNIGFILMPKHIIQGACSREPSPMGPLSFTSSV